MTSSYWPPPLRAYARRGAQGFGVPASVRRSWPVPVHERRRGTRAPPGSMTNSSGRDESVHCARAVRPAPASPVDRQRSPRRSACVDPHAHRPGSGVSDDGVATPCRPRRWHWLRSMANSGSAVLPNHCATSSSSATGSGATARRDSSNEAEWPRSPCWCRAISCCNAAKVRRSPRCWCSIHMAHAPRFCSTDSSAAPSSDVSRRVRPPHRPRARRRTGLERTGEGHARRRAQFGVDEEERRVVGESFGEHSGSRAFAECQQVPPPWCAASCAATAKASPPRTPSGVRRPQPFGKRRWSSGRRWPASRGPGLGQPESRSRIRGVPLGVASARRPERVQDVRRPTRAPPGEDGGPRGARYVPPSRHERARRPGARWPR